MTPNTNKFLFTLCVVCGTLAALYVFMGQTQWNDSMPRKAGVVEGLVDKYDVKMLTNYLSDNPEVISYHDAFDRHTILHYAVINPAVSTNVVMALVLQGAEINALDIDKQTPLHYAYYYNSHQDIISFLISLGADVNAKDVHGKTPAQLKPSAGVIKENK